MIHCKQCNKWHSNNKNSCNVERLNAVDNEFANAISDVKNWIFINISAGEALDIMTRISNEPTDYRSKNARDLLFEFSQTMERVNAAIVAAEKNDE